MLSLQVEVTILPTDFGTVSKKILKSGDFGWGGDFVYST